MKPRAKQFSFPSRSRRAERAGGARESRTAERGYALMVLILMATLLLISLAAAIPNVYLAGQREREQELIFRGTQYARAIALFRRQFNRYPTSVDELIGTNRIHFLRHAFRDPMSRNGKWRFIHADANGVPLDSKTVGMPSAGKPPGTSAISGQPAPSGGMTLGQQGFTGGATSGQPGSFGLGQQYAPGTTTGFQSSQSAQAGSQIQGAFIIGVASSSSRESVRVWNGHTHYDEWEFLATTTNLTAPAVQGAPAEPGKPGQGFPTVPPGLQGPLPPRPPETPVQNP